MSSSLTTQNNSASSSTAPPSKFDAAVHEWINVAKTVSAFDKIDVLAVCADGMTMKENIYATASATATTSPASPSRAAAPRRPSHFSGNVKPASSSSPTEQQQQARREAFVSTKASISDAIAELEREAQDDYEREMGKKESEEEAEAEALKSNDNDISTRSTDGGEGQGEVNNDEIAADIDDPDVIGASDEEKETDKEGFNATASSGHSSSDQHAHTEDTNDVVETTAQANPSADEIGKDGENIAAESMEDVVDNENNFSGTPPEEQEDKVEGIN